uniref:Orn/DAP/Arg decarboxylase 2 C-terminal domain-containing protein n=1 Tax=Odontella aurita TaxID=265563 RepID=A0A7S4KE41_9STRA
MASIEPPRREAHEAHQSGHLRPVCSTGGEVNSPSTDIEGHPRSRASAKEGVKSAWAERRLRSPRESLVGDDGVDTVGFSASKEEEAVYRCFPSSDEKRSSETRGQRSGGGGLSNLCRTWRDLQTNLTRAFDPKQGDQPRSSQADNDTGRRHASETTGMRSKPEAGAAMQGASGRTRASESSRRSLVETTARLQTAAAVAAEVTALGFCDRGVHCLDSKDEHSQGDGRDCGVERPDVSILPSRYDQSLALAVTASERRRAFLLLDLARVASAHRAFHSYASGPGVYSRDRTDEEMRAVADRRGKSVHVVPQFRVTANRDPHLLALLVRLGVGLRCGSGDDVKEAREAARKAMGEEEDQPSAPGMGNGRQSFPAVVDDATRTRKPDGYLRRLTFSLDHGAVSPPGGKGVDIAVDGPEEVRRVRSALRRFSLRRGGQDGNDCAVTAPSCCFILRLPPFGVTNDATASWEHLVRSTISAVKEKGCASDLSGVSIDLTPWKTTLESNISTNVSNVCKVRNHSSECNSDDSKQVLHKICMVLRWIRLFLIASSPDIKRHRMRIDLTGLPRPLTRHAAENLTSALATLVSSPPTENEVLTTMRHFGTEVNVCTDKAAAELDSGVAYTADLTHHLVSHAGALCTRIIGIKRATSEQDDTRAHVYIDDGCYGSLSSCYSSKSDEAKNEKGMANNVLAKFEFHPIPLYGGIRSESDLSSTFKTSSSTASNAQRVRATVWGPTCDGLDRVCEAAWLPDDLVTNRDWLVFPHMGCGGFGGGLGLGTAFNGFDPPDTAYCMLGYFSGYNNNSFKSSIG